MTYDCDDIKPLVVRCDESFVRPDIGADFTLSDDVFSDGALPLRPVHTTVMSVVTAETKTETKTKNPALKRNHTGHSLHTINTFNYQKLT